MNTPFHYRRLVTSSEFPMLVDRPVSMHAYGRTLILDECGDHAVVLYPGSCHQTVSAMCYTKSLESDLYHSHYMQLPDMYNLQSEHFCMNAEGSLWAIGYPGPFSRHVDLLMHEDDDDKVDPDWVVQQRIKIPKAYRETHYTYFGTAIAMDALGGRIAVSASGMDVDGIGIGKVFIYEKVYKKGTLKYRCTLEIDPPNGGMSGMLFGRSLSMSSWGHRLYIGSIATVGADSLERQPARVYEYVLENGQNGRMARLETIFEGPNSKDTVQTIDGVPLVVGDRIRLTDHSTESTDGFYDVAEGDGAYGISISHDMSGNIMAIGAPARKEVHIYRRQDIGGDWEYDHTVTHPEGLSMFGRQVILSQDGERLLVAHERPRFFFMDEDEGSDTVIEFSLFSIE